MNKVALFTAATLLSTAVCFAQTAKIPEQAMALAGTVKSVTVADPVKKTQSQVSISSSKGSVTSFIISPKTVIVNKNEKPVTLDKIISGASIIIQFNHIPGVGNEAIHIKVFG